MSAEAATTRSDAKIRVMVYPYFVRRIQPCMDDDPDYALTQNPDPVDALIGSVDLDPIDDIDAAIYLQ